MILYFTYQKISKDKKDLIRVNVKAKIRKLQTALIQKGKIYKINTYQFFSVEQNRMITGYSVTEKQEYKKKNGDIGVHDVELLNTCSQIEMLKWFAEEWEKTNGQR